MKTIKRILIASFTIIFAYAFILPCFALNNIDVSELSISFEIVKPQSNWIAMQGTSKQQLENCILPMKLHAIMKFKDKDGNDYFPSEYEGIKNQFIKVEWNLDEYDPTSNIDEYTFTGTYSFEEKYWCGEKDNKEPIFIEYNTQQNIEPPKVHVQMMNTNKPAGLIIYQISDFDDYNGSQYPYYLMSNDLSDATDISLEYSVDKENWVNVQTFEPGWWNINSADLLGCAVELNSSDSPFKDYYSGDISGFYMRLTINGGSYDGQSEITSFPFNFDKLEGSEENDDSPQVTPPNDDEGGEGNQGNIGGNTPDEPENEKPNSIVETPEKEDQLNNDSLPPLNEEENIVSDIPVVAPNVDEALPSQTIIHTNQSSLPSLNELAKNEDILSKEEENIKKSKTTTQAQTRKSQISNNEKKEDFFSLSPGVIVVSGIVTISAVGTLILIRKPPKFFKPRS